eukprot:SAG11_NODE_7484_length_1138_cov_0.942252_1_plen_67_part_10
MLESTVFRMLERVCEPRPELLGTFHLERCRAPWLQQAGRSCEGKGPSQWALLREEMPSGVIGLGGER